MPALMQLQGPSLGQLGYMQRTNVTPLSGVGSAILASPIIFLGGLVLGGYLAHKQIHPFRWLRGKIHGQPTAQTRSKALTGRRHRY